MTENPNPYVEAGYNTGDDYIEGLRKIAETRTEGDLQKAYEIAIQDLENTNSPELLEGTMEAFRWLQNQGELKE